MEELTIERLISATRRYLPDLNEGRLLKAYEFARIAHEGQQRFSGDPYIIHPLATAFLLLSLQADEDTLVAALLHDVPRETEYGLRDIEQRFDRSVSALVSAVHKLRLIKMQPGTSQGEVWRKMVMAMAKDLRAIFIKLAERLHNMRTLEFVPEAKRARIAEETLRVYAPIASRLGLYAFKNELEDLSFKVLHRLEYEELSTQLATYGVLYERSMRDSQAELERLLREEGIEAEVSGRVKHRYSIYRKLKKKGVNRVDALHDLFAMRVVLKDQFREGKPFVGHCYTVLGLLHNRWNPIPGRFKDYIAVPKLNGYQSLHTTLLNLLPSFESQPVEIQIRTESMHRDSDLGVAAHWLYETTERGSTEFSKSSLEPLIEGRRLVARLQALLGLFPQERLTFQGFFQEGRFNVDRWTPEFTHFLKTQKFTLAEVDRLKRFLESPLPSDRRLRMLQDQLDWLCGIQTLPDLTAIPTEGSEGLESNLFSDRIFILTPEGEVKDLPEGATPIDFAYAVHTDLGNRCHQARVNGVLVPLNHPLSNGDVVEIVTRKLAQPNRYWLSFVKTMNAKNRIKAWFRSMDREKNIRTGRDLLNRELRRLKKPLLGPQYQLLNHYGGKPLALADREHVVELVGNGTMTPNQVIRGLFPEVESSVVLPSKPVAPATGGGASVVESDRVLVTGEADLPILLAACCKPKRGDPIIGHITQKKFFRIHRRGCYQLDAVEPGRLLPAHWEGAQHEMRFRVGSRDRVGLLRDLLAVVADQGCNVVDVPLVDKNKDGVIRDLILNLPEEVPVVRLVQSLTRVSGVESVAVQDR